MGIRDEVLAYNTRIGAKCSVGMLLASMDKKQQAELQSVLSDPQITAVAIAKYYKRQGVSVTSTTFARHRRGACSCGN